MPSYVDDVLKPAIANQELPGVILMAGDVSGELDVFEIHGDSVLADAPGGAVPLARDAVFPLMSMTKLLTAVAILHAAEAGILNLDADITQRLPELGTQSVFTGVDTSTTTPKPNLTPRTKPLTLRHLLTHSSGCTYEFLPNSPIHPYMATQPPRDPMASYTGPISSRFAYPLVFQPGESWTYGTGYDWAGLLLERASGVSLEEYCRKNIFDKVGVKPGSLTFFPSDEAKKRLWGSTPLRHENGKVVHGDLHPPANPPSDGICAGGTGVFGEMGEYFKVMVSLLLDDGKILGKEMSAGLFKPQLEPGAKEKLQSEMEGNSGWITGWIPDTGKYDHALGGLVVDEDGTMGLRRKGAIFWGGMYNPAWIVDREAGVCAIWATNMLPPGDAKAKEHMRQWEEYVYKVAKK